MNWAQRSVSPTRATLIYTGEPVWAGIFGRLAGDGCASSFVDICGGGLRFHFSSLTSTPARIKKQPRRDLADRREP
jgi:hypothetical protein